MEEELERLSISELKTELFAFLNFEKGIPLAYVSMFKKPYKTIQTYLNKDRRHIINPLKYLLLSVAAYTLLVNYHKGFQNFKTEANKANEKGFESLKNLFNENLYEKFLMAQDFYLSSINLVYLFAVPVVALITYWFFKKYNYIENLAIHCYMFGTANWTSFLVMLLTFAFDVSGNIMYLLMLFTYSIISYLLKNIYQLKWITALATQLLLLFVFMIIGQLCLIGIFLYFIIFT
ncbi:hypothetical protein WH52_08080 [Tenacibaculum holothuriorum]|uniref:DUF3667 domain-containing protein n=1 Tax=Tenacibaculum holothuriorum TaxID=1635173 RepID=A0A1Y2PBY0_9FLAO|nr:hypothetical protein [Tenacibaculum holothuriorum]OSY87983.1 hypothetical protein WH52_08080 [Tenacibaculum holothuriorum]